MAKTKHKRTPHKKNVSNYQSIQGKYQEKISPDTQALLRTMQPLSLQRGIFNIATFSSETIDRDSEYVKRTEMYQDTFTRGMAQVILTKSIGSSNNQAIPFDIVMPKKFDLPEADQEILEKEFKHLKTIINKELFEVAMDSLFYGDGYAKIVLEDGKGVTGLLTNFSTKAPNIISIVSNRGGTVAFEVGASAMYRSKGNIIESSRNYVTKDQIARMSAKSNGTYTLLTEQAMDFQRLSVFNEEELYYEDGIYGGVVEDSYDDYLQFKWALQAVGNARVASAVVERFITHTLGNVSTEERLVLKNALTSQIENTTKAMATRMKDKDPTPLIANHLIATVGDNVNGVSIQESSPNVAGLASIEDIMLHIKKYVEGVGFSLELTSFRDNSQGGGEKDGSFTNSLRLEEIGSRIRDSVREYILSIVTLHFKAKYNKDISEEIAVEFNNILNTSKLKAEMQRMEAVSNSQQFLGIIEQLKTMQFEDNEDTREMLKNELETIINQATNNRQDVIETYIEFILTPPKEEDDAI